MINHVIKHPKAALWVPMGSGKTVCTLTALQWLTDHFYVYRTLIVAPLRVARKTWTDEIGEWDHINLDSLLLLGSTPAKQREAKLDSLPALTVINRELLPWLVDTCKSRATKEGVWWPWDTVVLDEARSFKEVKSLRFRRLRQMLPYVDRIIQLTGTPAANGYGDLYAQMFLLDEGTRLGRTKQAFERAYYDFDPYNRFDRRLKPDAEKRIIAKVQDICLSLRDEDLHGAPTVQYLEAVCEMSDQAREQYEVLETEHLLPLAEGGEVDAQTAGVLFGKLRQLANGAVYYDDQRNWHAVHSAKIDQLVGLLESMDEQVMITYQWRHDKERILLALEDRKDLRVRVLRTERDEDDWNAGRIDVLLLHPASAGHGLNLHKSGGRRLIHFGPTPDLDQYLQVNARLFGGHRGKGRQGVIIHLLTAGTIDHTIMGMLKQKREAQDRLIDGTASADWMVQAARQLVADRKREGAFLL